KLVWMNGEYIRRQPREVYAAEFTARMQAAGLSIEGRDLAGILEQMQIRTKFYSEIPGACAYFFTEEYPFDEKGVAKRLKAEGVPELLEEVARRYEALPNFDVQSTHDVLAAMGEARGSGLGAMVHPVRVAVSGLTEGPGLFEMLALIGREPVCARLRRVARRLRDGTLGGGA
ncbi:MAG TPA: glutamate--tRNA ligase, partial [Kiritimatiellia bacterium]|nr:glutamate--tRNA ligase [Kiritimatiellia bacterium]